MDAVVKLKHGTISEAKAYTIHYGEVYTPVIQNEVHSVILSEAHSVILSGVEGSTLLDQVLVSVFRAPHSYTGEDCAEISTHASSYIVNELVRLLMEAGARFAQDIYHQMVFAAHGKVLPDDFRRSPFVLRA